MLILLFTRWLMPHSVLLYNVTVVRSWQPYARGYIAVQSKSRSFRSNHVSDASSNQLPFDRCELCLSLYSIHLVVLNFVGFCAFWLPPSCGERMGLSITAMLAALASEIVIAAKLPAAKEITWFSRFSIMSLTFAFASLLGMSPCPSHPCLCLTLTIPCN